MLEMIRFSTLPFLLLLIHGITTLETCNFMTINDSAGCLCRYPNGTDDSFILLTLNIGITRMRKEYPKKFKLKSVNPENRKYGQE